MPDHTLPYPPDPVQTFAILRSGWPHAAWLDGAAGGRYSVLAADPERLLVSAGGRTRVMPRGGPSRVSAADPLAELADSLGPAVPAEPPFSGGAIGYFGYELGRRLQGQAPAPGGCPEMAVGIYRWALVLDHARRTAVLRGAPPAGVAAALRAPPPPAALGDWVPRGPVSVTPDAAGYRAAFARVARYIRDGDCYQVNLARTFRAPFSGDALAVYRDLRRLAGGPFSAYLDLPGGPVLSGSPERFLALRAGRVETRPIKGTRPRAAEPAADAAIRAALAASAKDRAENVMIVDLLRNDLGRSCATGSIRVPELCALETYATVHHMVSAVTGRLAPGRHATDLLRDCLPGGSITGAPKYRAMEIIDELEPAPRGVYCGAIGYLGFDGAMDTSVAIRTATACAGVLEYRAGGGLVADSACAEELEETEIKAAAFRRLLAGAAERHAADRQSRGDADMMQ